MRFIIIGLLYLSTIQCDQLNDMILQWVNSRGSSSSPQSQNSCRTDDGQSGVCVKMSQCATGDQKVDLPSSFAFRRGQCHYLLQCCRKNQVQSRTVPETVTRKAECGWSNPGANVLKKKSMTYADYGEFPWMVGLLRKSRRSSWDQTYIGGGSLIHPSVVVTAAHKVDDISDPNKLLCRAGEWDTRTEHELYKYQERDVSKIITHHDFSRTNVRNDIALLIMSEQFDLSEAPHIGLACLGKSMPPPGTQCFSMGWGAEFGYMDTYAYILKKVQLPLVKADTCQTTLRNFGFSSDYELHASFTCAGGQGGLDTCAGDGGSSLVCPIEGSDGRYAMYGIVAFGPSDCGERDIPGVYVNIPEMTRWIDDQMLLEKLDKTYRY